MNESQWQQVLLSIKQTHNTIYGITRLSSMLYRDSCVELRFQFPFHRKRLSQPGVLQIIADVAASVTSASVTIRIMDGDNVINEATGTDNAQTDPVPELIVGDEVSRGISQILEGLINKDEADRIFLQHVHISNFRALTEVDIELNAKVNVLIGANNTGKSAIVDAIRLALQVGRYRKTKFVSIEDFNDIDKEIAIDLRFYCPDSIKGIPELKIFELDDSGKRKAYLELHVRYYTTGIGEGRQVRQQFWGGNTGGKVPDDDALDIFSFDYLDALRDAKFVLRPSTKSKIADLLLNLRAGKIDRKKIEEVFEDAQKHPEVIKLITEANNSVQSHVSKIALKNDEFSVNFQPLPPIFEELVGGFDVRLLTAVLSSTVSQNGLGYNNVLYASTVLGHIRSAQVRDPERYHALLIEEPEAHLHPQLEDSLFSYISNRHFSFANHYKHY